MPSLISHHLSSQTVHWTFPPATITGEWRRKPSPLPLHWEASAQESPVGMRSPQVSSAWTSLSPQLHLHGNNYRAALRLYSCSTQLSDEHSNVQKCYYAIMKLGVTVSTITYSSLCHLRGLLPRGRHSPASHVRVLERGERESWSMCLYPKIQLRKA